MTMTTNKTSPEILACEKTQKRPTLNISKIGIVARDYNETESFGDSLPEILQLLDKKGCDAVLFSLFSLETGYDPREAFKGLKNIKAIFVEEFTKKRNPETGKPTREGKGFVVYHRTPSGWKEYWRKQKFGSLSGRSPKKNHELVGGFVKDELPNRCLGNCCVLLCGESNGVKYSKDDKAIHDDFKLRKAIPKEARIILNPCHDYMSLPVMKKKREYLSKNCRWVISVWCKGKTLENGTRRDARGPAWTIYHNGKEQKVDETKHDCGAAVYIGILDIRYTVNGL